MATVTFSAVPDRIAPLNCAIWSISMSDGGVDPLIERMAFELFKVSGGSVQITERSVIDYIGQDLDVNFPKAAQPYIRTQLPNLGSNSIQQLTEFGIETSLFVGRIVNDTDACTSEYQGDFSSNPATIVNAAIQPYEMNPFASGNTPTAAILSRRPAKYTICQSQYDYLYVYCPSSAVVGYDIKWKTKEGIVANTIFGNLAGDDLSVSAIPLWVGGAPFVSAEIVDKIEVTITGTTNNGTFVINVGGCGDKNENKYSTLFSLEPLGGYSCLYVEMEKSINRVNSGYMSRINCLDSVSSKMINGGYTSTNSQSYNRVKLTHKAVGRRDELWEWIGAMMSTNQHYLLMDGELVKFIPESSAINSSRVDGPLEAQITGRLHYNYAVQEFNM